MNCRETERLLDTFFDGELDGRLMRDAALHITRCPSCEKDLRAKEAVRGALAGTIQQEVESVDLSSIWAGVEGAIQGEQPGTAADEPAAPEESAPRRLFGRRTGGRHADSSSRSARTGSRRRASAAAGMGAVAVGLAAFLLFPAEQAQLSDEKYSDAASQEGTTDGIETRVAAPAKRGPTAQQVAAAKVPSRSGVETIALAPDANEEQLSSEWTQQLQVGPAEFNDHAMSLWRDTSAR